MKSKGSSSTRHCVNPPRITLKTPILLLVDDDDDDDGTSSVCCEELKTIKSWNGVRRLITPEQKETMKAHR